MNLNKVILIGNLTRDPEIKSLPSGTSVASFGLATNRSWKDQKGQKQTDTQFHNVVVFGKQAEIAGQYLKKGASAMIEGRIQTRAWDAQDGSKRTKTEIVVEKFQMGPRRGEQAGQAEQGNFAQPQKGEAKESLDTIEYPEEEINPEEIPF